MRHQSVRTLSRAAVGVLAAATMLPVMSSPAHAEPTNAPPVPGDDQVTVYASGMREVNLLANDTDPDGDRLRVCHIETAPYRAVILMGMNLMHSVDYSLVPDLGDMLSDLDDLTAATVMAGPRAKGTKTFTYDVCDRHHVVPATVTVTVLPTPKVTVRKIAGKPGRLKVTNPSTVPMRFHWHTHRRSNALPPLPARAAGADHRARGTVRVPAGATRTVRVKGPVVEWAASGRRDAFTVGGKVRGIRTR